MADLNNNRRPKPQQVIQSIKRLKL